MTTWTLRDLQALLLRERGLRVSVCTLHRVAHALGDRYRRPRHDLRHRQDAQAVAAARPLLDPILVYVDECEIHTHPHLAQDWRKKGHPMRFPAARADQKYAIFGALHYASGRLVHSISPRKDETTFMTFLEQLLQAIPPDETLVVVLDNAGYHKSQAVREWWRAHAEQLHPFFLPAYTPQLNLIERLWRYLKHKLARHRWWNDLEQNHECARDRLLRVHMLLRISAAQDFPPWPSPLLLT
jgi:transposase